ncbi:NAD-dependent protein deacetylase Sirt2 [Armadillidium vulgare]|nr:NAD-dependent protein deacetylase Sirt2 [Armadillidium vulgare]
MQYDTAFAKKEQTTKEILVTRKGVAKDFVLLFNELSFIAGLKTMTIQGFAKGYDHRTGKMFDPAKDELHLWVAVHVFGSWRFVDPHLHQDSLTNKDLSIRDRRTFFLTDPKDMILTHFLTIQITKNTKVALLEEPITWKNLTLTEGDATIF